MKEKLILEVVAYSYNFGSEYPQNISAQATLENGEIVSTTTSSSIGWVESDLFRNINRDNYEVIDKLQETYKIVKENWMFDNRGLLKQHALSKLSGFERQLLGV